MSGLPERRRALDPRPNEGRSEFERALARGADLAFCREATRTGSRSFFAASALLPREARAAAFAFYAFCREADDAVDTVDIDLHGEGNAATLKLRALDGLRERLRRLASGAPEDRPADRAFAAVVERCAIPEALPAALLEGLEWDARGRGYEDLEGEDGLVAYAVRVAGAVGAVMALIMGVRDARALARAADLGVAMQLTNVARDVGEDARMGRVYLPGGWLREAGLEPGAFSADPAFDRRVAGVVARLLARAETLYARGLAGVALLPASCRPGIRAAGLLYRAIGEEVAENGFDSVAARAVVPPARKAKLLARAALPTPKPDPAALEAPPLPQARFLLDAAGALRPEPAPATGLPRLVELWAELERRERRVTALRAVR